MTNRNAPPRRRRRTHRPDGSPRRPPVWVHRHRPLNQHNFFAFNSSRRINIRRRLRGPFPVLGAISRIRPGKRSGNTNLHIRLCVKCHAHTTRNRKMKSQLLSFRDIRYSSAIYSLAPCNGAENINYCLVCRRLTLCRHGRGGRSKIPPGRNGAIRSLSDGWQ